MTPLNSQNRISLSPQPLKSNKPPEPQPTEQFEKSPEPEHNFAKGAGHWAECITTGNAALGGAIALGGGALALGAAAPIAVVAGIAGAVLWGIMGNATGEVAGDLGARLGSRLGVSEPTSRAVGKTLAACLMTCGAGVASVVGSLVGIGIAGTISHFWHKKGDS